MLRDFKFLDRNSGNNPSAEDAENVPVNPKFSLSIPLREDSSRAPLNTIQDPSHNPRFVQEHAWVHRSKTERSPTENNLKIPESSFLTQTPENQDGQVLTKYKFGSSQCNEPILNAVAHNEDRMVDRSSLWVGVGNGSIAKAASHPTRSNGMTNSNYSESISVQTTPTKSVSKPPNPGLGLTSYPLLHANAARVGNLTSNYKGVPISYGPSTIVDTNEVAQFDLKEDPSFWIDHNVQVIIRVRPLNGLEKSMHGYNRCLKQESSQTITWVGHPETRFTFDHVASELVDQETLFRMVGEPMVENCLLGYNSCIFAYGQTGSGKTYTMLGDIQHLEVKPSRNCGLTPRIFDLLIARMRAEEEKRNNEDLKYNCKCSFLEIYNEQITDLLDPSSTNLLLREDIKKGVYVENLSEFEVNTVNDILFLLAQGSSNRKVAATNMNRESSRSHSVFTCVIESRWEKDSTANRRFARLNLVDLAGSERQKSSGAEGERLREAANINKSLSTLGHVIKVLVDVANGKMTHVPYRDSRLTFLLQDSLGGNSKTMIIANVSPSFCGAAETLNTLKFAQRAKLIQNNAVVNENTSGDVMALQQQLVVLKEELSVLQREKIIRSLSFDSAMASGSTQRHENVCMEVRSAIDKHSDDSYMGSASKYMMVVSSKQLRSFEETLAGSLRREQIAEATIIQLEGEMEKLNHLVRQREEDTRGNKMMLKFREHKIQRMESVINGLTPVDSYLLEENKALHNEIQILNAKINRKNPEVIRFASENIKLSHQLRRFQEFYEEGERKLLLAEISALRDQILHYLDGNCYKHSSTTLTMSDRESPGLTKEKDSLQLESKTTAEELEDCRRKLQSSVNENARLCREIDSLRFNLHNEPPDLGNGVKPVEELELELPLWEPCTLKSVRDKTDEEQQAKIILHNEEVIHLQMELDLLKIFLKEERLAAHCEIDEKEKLMGMQQSLERARRLNMWYQSNQVFHASNEEEMDEVRKQAEVETAEVIVCLQEELVTLQHQIQDSNIKLSESEDCIMHLETELEELQGKLDLATKDNQMLDTLVEKKTWELRASYDQWEQLTDEIIDVLLDGNEALNDVSDQLYDVSGSCLQKKTWISGQFSRMINIISEKEFLIEELNKCLDDVNNSKNDVDSMLNSLKDATMIITEAQQLECSENRKKNLLLLSEIDSKTHNIAELENKLRMQQFACSENEKKNLLLLSEIDSKIYNIVKLENELRIQVDQNAKVSLCATAAFVIINRLSEMNTNHLNALKDKDSQLMESAELNLKKDGLLQEYIQMIDEAKKKNQNLELQLETFEETCDKVIVEHKALKEVYEALKVDLAIKCDFECSEKEKKNLLLLSDIDSKTRNIAELENKLRMQVDQTAKVSLCATAAFVIVNRLSEMNTNHHNALKDKDGQLKESAELNLKKDGLLQECFQLIDEAKKENQNRELQLETFEETSAKIRVEHTALKEMYEALKDELAVKSDFECSENKKKNILLLSEIDYKTHSISELENKLRMQVDQTAKVSLCATAAFVIVNRLSEINTNHHNALKDKDGQLKESAALNLKKDSLLQEYFQMIDESKKENQNLKLELEMFEETCAKVSVEHRALKEVFEALKVELAIKCGELDEAVAHDHLLEDQLLEKSVTIFIFELEILQSKETLDLLSSKNFDLCAQTKDALGEKSSIQEDLIEKVKIIDGLEMHLTELGYSHESLNTKLTVVTDERDYLQSEMILLKGELEKLRVRAQETEAQLLEKSGTISTLELEILQARETLDLLSSKNFDLCAQTKDALEEKNSIQEDLIEKMKINDGLEMHLTELGYSHKSLNSKLTVVTDERDYFQSEMILLKGELEKLRVHAQETEAQLLEKSGTISTLESEILQAKETLDLLSSKNFDLCAQTKNALGEKSSIQEDLIEKMKIIDGLEMHLTELGYFHESLNTKLTVVTDERDYLQSEMILLKGELEKLRVCAQETEAIVVNAEQMAEERRIYVEEKDKEVKLLERSVEELECTVNVLENKVDIVKGEVERHELQRIDLELELHAVKDQLKDVEIGDSDIKRLLFEKENKVQEAHEHLQILEREIVTRDAEISKCKAHISELNLHAEAQAREYKQKFKALEAMADVSLKNTNPSSNKFEKNSKLKGSGSPFKCIGLSSTHELKSEKDEELMAGRLRIDELEAIATARQKEIFILNTKLASAESMTHDLNRDLLGVKLDMTNYASLLENQQLRKFTDKAGFHGQEFHEKEDEVNRLKQQFNEVLAEKDGLMDEINKKQAESVALQVSVERLHQRDQLLTAENEMFKTENLSHKKRVIELESAVTKLSGQQNLQQRIHHHAKIKEENNLLKAHNGDLRAKLHRTEASLSRVKEELASYRAANGKQPYIDFDMEQKLSIKLKETEEERLQLGQKLLGLCTCILEANGEIVSVQEVNTCVAENALELLKRKAISLERELEALKNEYGNG